MIPPVEDRDVRSSAPDDSVSFDISEDDVAWIMSILRDTLYSDKIMAVLREYSTNAWDSMRMSGKADVPIEVTMPTLGTPELVIRDRGDGLSHDDIRRVYTKYGASTKRDNNDGAGMLGIGSKSGFAYSDSFTITSWNGGMKRMYIAVLNDEKGRCDLVHSEPCGEETGVEIRIAVKPADIPAFESRAKRLFSHFRPRPKINITLEEEYVGREVPGLGHVDEREGYEHRGKWLAVMGPVAYSIDLAQLSGEAGGERLGNAASNTGGVLPFDIGALQVSASREGLKYGDATRAALIKRINGIIDEYVRLLLKDIDKLSNWDRRLRIRLIQRRSLPVPAQFRNDGSSGYVNIRTSAGPSASLGFSNRNYNGRMVQTTHINVQPEVRLVIRNEKRAMGGYSLKETDIVVTPMNGNGISDSLVRKLLNDWCKEHAIEGIPITILSSVTWTKPEDSRGPGSPRDNARAKARSFVLDPTKGFRDDDRAKTWSIVDRVPHDSDVFVVLESYRVDGMEGFYETYRQDESMFKRLGLNMPPVYGYKSTKAKPVAASSCKGTEYRKWRSTGMVKLLMAVPGVALAAQSSAYDVGYPALDRSWLAKQLGEDHPLVAYATAEGSGRTAWGSIKYEDRLAANHVRGCMTGELTANRQRTELRQSYPLLAVTHDLQGVRDSQQRDLWIGYIRLVDAAKAAETSEGNKQQREEAAA